MGHQTGKATACGGRDAADAEDRFGAYGLSLPDLAGARELLVPAPSHWIPWSIERRIGEGRPEEFVGDGHARVWSQPTGWVEIDRARRTATLNLPAVPGDREVVHPFMASTAIVVARWNGWQCFHAGAFVLDRRAWVILGAKGAGKSSLLASIALAGIPVLTDDVLVVRHGWGLAGPRCVDLRTESAQRLGVGEPIGVVGQRERWRVPVGAVQPEVALGGWVCLEWGERRFERVPAAERPALLLGSLGLRVPPTELDAMFDLLELPTFRLRHPRGIGELQSTCELLVEQLSA